jgi:hypothetical protein
MASKEPDELLLGLLKQRWATRANITYLWGNPTKPEDLQRARISHVELCFVLADVNANPLLEDLQNIVRAAAVCLTPRPGILHPTPCTLHPAP